MAASRDKVVEPDVAPLPLGRVIAFFAVAFVVIFGAALALFWRVGVFDTNTSATNGQIVAAALALVGVLVTASLTFIGVILKHSIDTRTLEQTKATEGRLRLETAIQAVELLTEDGKPGTPTRQAGAIFVLVSLGQLDFAFALLGQVWANREISPGAAVWVVNRLLLEGDDRLQKQATSLLNVNADSLATPSGLEFPECVRLRWRNDLISDARTDLIVALLKALLAKPRDDWTDGDIGEFILQFDLVWKSDANTTVRNNALLSLDALLRVRPMEEGTVLPAPWGEDVLVDGIRVEVEALAPSVDEFAYEVQRLATRLLDEWGPDEGESTRPGPTSNTTRERDELFEDVRRDV